uniref:Sulfatase N-terminal domain-containing protein n=1 Tax=Pseudonaja textilis TaxID=8673 RepID=A0A670XY85_PSETE
YPSLCCGWRTAEGVKLTQHIAAATTCTPSRAAFLTGRYPIRSGRVLIWTGASGGLPVNETTFAKLLQQKGYAAGIIGKWHQSVNCESHNDHCHHPLKHGFDYFYGAPFTLINECQCNKDPEVDVQLQATYWLCTQMIALFTLLLIKMTTLFPVKWKTIAFITFCGILFFISWFAKYGFIRYWNCMLMRDHTVIEQPRKCCLQDKTIPLFVSFLHVHTPCFTIKIFHGKSQNGLYGDNVEEMDWIVGRIFAAVDRVGLRTNTFTYFTSDHGGYLEFREGNIQVGGWNGRFKDGKGMGGWEGGIRVPGIVRWPGKITPNTVLDEPTSLMDIYPTVAHLAGASVPQDRIIDGKNLVPLLLEEVRHSEHEFMFHYCGSYLHAVHWYQKESGALWKVHYVTPNFQPQEGGPCYGIKMCQCFGDEVTHHNPPLLFNLSRDLSETNRLSPTSEPLFNVVISQMATVVTKHRNTLTPVAQQLDVYNTVWKPWLQPCCGTFPFCWCNDESNNDIIIK